LYAGAEDIMWLQSDFGLHLLNAFDGYTAVDEYCLATTAPAAPTSAGVVSVAAPPADGCKALSYTESQLLLQPQQRAGTSAAVRHAIRAWAHLPTAARALLPANALGDESATTCEVKLQAITTAPIAAAQLEAAAAAARCILKLADVAWTATLQASATTGCSPRLQYISRLLPPAPAGSVPNGPLPPMAVGSAAAVASGDGAAQLRHLCWLGGMAAGGLANADDGRCCVPVLCVPSVSAVGAHRDVGSAEALGGGYADHTGGPSDRTGGPSDRALARSQLACLRVPPFDAAHNSTLRLPPSAAPPMYYRCPLCGVSGIGGHTSVDCPRGVLGVAAAALPSVSQ
jgi:hypothetical protein